MTDEYDKSIHHNPDAKVWAEFFIKTKEQQNWNIDDIDEGLMLGWFANAMMAMHDNLHQRLKEAEENNIKLRKSLDKITDLHIEDGSIMQRIAYEALGE